MKRFKNVNFLLRIFTGILISGHGLLRIVFLSKYMDFVLDNYYDVISAETGLTMVAALLPFLEFFVGLLIIGNVNLKKMLWISFMISLLMGIFIVIKDFYPRLIYHFVVVVLLLLLGTRTKNQQTPTLSV